MLGHYLAIPKVGEYRRTKASCNQWSLYIEKETGAKSMNLEIISAEVTLIYQFHQMVKA